MTATVEIIPRPLYRVLQKMTHEPRIEVALSIAVKDLIRLRLKEVAEQRRAFETKYGMTFAEFRSKFEAEAIPDQYSYTVESDFWDWEAAVTNEAHLLDLQGGVL